VPVVFEGVVNARTSNDRWNRVHGERLLQRDDLRMTGSLGDDELYQRRRQIVADAIRNQSPCGLVNRSMWRHDVLVGHLDRETQHSVLVAVEELRKARVKKRRRIHRHDIPHTLAGEQIIAEAPAPRHQADACDRSV
jgi:hypothetical protein